MMKIRDLLWSIGHVSVLSFNDLHYWKGNWVFVRIVAVGEGELERLCLIDGPFRSFVEALLGRVYFQNVDLVMIWGHFSVCPTSLMLVLYSCLFDWDTLCLG